MGTYLITVQLDSTVSLSSQFTGLPQIENLCLLLCKNQDENLNCGSNYYYYYYYYCYYYYCYLRQASVIPESGNWQTPYSRVVGRFPVQKDPMRDIMWIHINVEIRGLEKYWREAYKAHVSFVSKYDRYIDLQWGGYVGEHAKSMAVKYCSRSLHLENEVLVRVYSEWQIYNLNLRVGQRNRKKSRHVRFSIRAYLVNLLV
jgi:hypothetical protein